MLYSNFHYEAPEFVTDLLFYNNAFVVIKSSSFSRLRMWAPVYRIVLMVEEDWRGSIK